MASRGQTTAGVSTIKAKFKANTANVKSLIRRFELLASCASVPDVRKAYLGAGGSWIPAPRHQQGKDKTNLRAGEKAIGVAQDINTEEQQDLVRRLLGVPSKMTSSGLLEFALESVPPHLPLPLATKPRSLYNSVTGTEEAPKLSPDAGVGSTQESNIGCALVSTQHCASGPRQVLRRLGQTVKRKASFFLEQSQKLDDLPMRKSPPPRRIFGSGENVRRKVSKKVMEKVDAVRRASGEFWKKDASTRDEEWAEASSSHHIGDGANDGNGTGVGVVVLESENCTGTSITAGQKIITTEGSCSSSSASYPLTSPTTPPVIKKIPPMFIDSLLNRSIKPTASIDGLTGTKELIFYKIGPGRAPDIKRVPASLERGMSSTGTLLTTDESKSPSLTEKGTFKSGKLAKMWQNSSDMGRSAGGDEVWGDMHCGDEITRRKRVTPPKISVKSLIAKFRQVDVVTGIDSRKLQYRALGTAQNSSVEVQFDEDSGGDEGETEDHIWKATPKRSLSIKTFMRSGGVQTTRSATYTFISNKTEIKGDRRRGHRNGSSLHGQPSKEYLLSGSGRRSFRLKIAPEPPEYDSLDADENQRSGEYEGTVRAENEISHSPNSNVDVAGAWDLYSTETGNGTPSLTSTETIITRKNSSVSHRQFYGHSSEEYVEPKVEYNSIGGEPRWSQSSWESMHDCSQALENSGNGNWRNTGLQMYCIRPEYGNESRKQHDQLQRYGRNDCRRMERPGNTYRGTPAPAEFITRKGVKEGKGGGHDMVWNGGSGGESGEEELESEEEDGDVASYSISSSLSEASERIQQYLTQRGGCFLDELEDGIEMQSIRSRQNTRQEGLGRVILNEYRVDTSSGEDGDIINEDSLVSSETAASTSPDAITFLTTLDNIPLELTPPLLLNNTSEQRHHHRAHEIFTRQHIGVPGEEDPGPYPIPRTASAAGRLARQHEAAIAVVNTVLWDGMGGLESLAGVDVRVAGTQAEWKRWGKMGGVWEHEYEYGQEWNEERKIGVMLPVRGVPIERVVVPKPRNLVLKRVIERAVLAWA